MRLQVCFFAAAVLCLAACAQSLPSGSASQVSVTGSRIQQDPRILDPSLLLVYPADGEQPTPYAGANLQRALWPYVQVRTP